MHTSLHTFMHTPIHTFIHRCAVIGLQSTGEAALDRITGDDAPCDGAMGELYSLCREMLRGFIEHNFPVSQQASAPARAPPISEGRPGEHIGKPPSSEIPTVAETHAETRANSQLKKDPR